MRSRCRLLCLVLALILIVQWLPMTVSAQEDKLPSKFDPRESGKVTAVRQTPDSFNLCWAYATAAAVEQSIIFHSLDNASVDLSESALAWFSSDSEKESVEASERYDNNYIIAPVFAMSRLCGLQYESEEPVYLSTPYLNPVSYSQNGLSDYELESVEKVSGEIDVIKRKLMEYGGAAVCYYSDLDCFSSDHRSYFQNERTEVNHSVTVIGWDDDYSRENFGAVKPDRDGAWLVKSVWGTRNENGYYWISYCEKELEDFYFYKVKKTASDTVYTHNGGMDRMFVSSKETVQAANVFTAQSNEVLTDVSFFIEENDGKGTQYRVRVYKDLKEDSPIGNTECADIEGKVTYEGYYTVKIPEKIDLSKDERFSVVVSLRSENGKNFFLAEESGCEYEKGQTYYYSSEKGWQDCAESLYKNAYINAYTQKKDKPDKSELKALVNELDGKKGIKRELEYAKKIIDNGSAGHFDVKKAFGLLRSASNECNGYTVISTADEWNRFAEDVNSGVQYRNKTVVLEADIDFSGVDFVPAGISQDRCFNGCFKGGGHILRNITVKSKDNEPKGVFGYLGKYAYVNGMIVSDSSIEAVTAGGIAGICCGGTITQCGSKGNIKADTHGGIVGILENGTISDCWCDCNGTDSIAGKLAKDEKYCISNCFVSKIGDELVKQLNSNGDKNKSFERFELKDGIVMLTDHELDASKGQTQDNNDANGSKKLGVLVPIALAVLAANGVVFFVIHRKLAKKKR